MIASASSLPGKKHDWCTTSSANQTNRRQCSRERQQSRKEDPAYTVKTSRGGKRPWLAKCCALQRTIQFGFQTECNTRQVARRRQNATHDIAQIKVTRKQQRRAHSAARSNEPRRPRVSGPQTQNASSSTTQPAASTTLTAGTAGSADP
jgi:hypothetical protein